MSGEEIRKKIEQNNTKLEILTQAVMSTFILNPEVAEIIMENRKLQDECPHEFEEGFCKFCGKEKDN